MRRNQFNGCIVLLLGFLCSCGKTGSNIADCEEGNPKVKCETGTADDRARKAIDTGDLASAIKILKSAIAEEPSVYRRYPLLGAAYAALAGFDIFNVAKAQFNSGGTVLDLMKTFLPDPAVLAADDYSTALDLMNQSVGILSAIPAHLRLATSGEKYAASASFQLTLYQSAYSVMYLNKFAYTAASAGKIDITNLETMSDADAEAILGNLAAAAAVQQGEQGAQVQTAVAAAQASIAAQPGSTSREKLLNYMATKSQTSQSLYTPSGH